MKVVGIVLHFVVLSNFGAKSVAFNIFNLFVNHLSQSLRKKIEVTNFSIRQTFLE